MNVSLHLFEEDNFWQTGEVLADILYSTKKYRKEENSNKYEFILNWFKIYIFMIYTSKFFNRIINIFYHMIITVKLTIFKSIRRKIMSV